MFSDCMPLFKLRDSFKLITLLRYLPASGGFIEYFMSACLVGLPASAEEKRDLGIQLAENPPMQIISRTPPVPAPMSDDVEIRPGFKLIKTLTGIKIT